MKWYAVYFTTCEIIIVATRSRRRLFRRISKYCKIWNHRWLPDYSTRVSIIREFESLHDLYATFSELYHKLCCCMLMDKPYMKCGE